MTGTAHEGGGVKVLKVNARYLESGEVLLERDSIAPLNLIRKVDGRVLVFPSTRVTVYDPLARGGIRGKVTPRVNTVSA